MLLPRFLAAIPDHRRPQGRLYGLAHRLLLCILALLSAATSYRKSQRVIDTRLPRLNTLCGWPWRRAPAHTAIRYALQRLDPADVEEVCRGQAAVLDGPCDRLTGIAVDGKPWRGRFDRFQEHKALQGLSTLTTERPLILGQLRIGAAGKSHEIPAAQQWIDELGLSGRLFTRDAVHCPQNG